MVMPVKPNPTAFPAFPTTFNETDAARIKDLERQKAAIGTALNTKLSTEAWKNVNPIEKGIRGVTQAVASIIPPLNTGTTDLGLTPEHAIQKEQAVEQEYKELIRKRQVVQIAPLVQDAIRMLALTPDGQVTEADFTSIFKLKELGFNEIEIDSMKNFARRVSESSPEDIASGKIMELPPVSEETLAQLMKDDKAPRMVYGSIALSKDLESITAALKESYAPNVKDESAKNQVIANFTKNATGASKGLTQEQFDAMLKDGIPIAITNSQGVMTNGKQKPDGMVTMSNPDTGIDEVVGWVDPKDTTGTIQPLNPNTGKPYTPESWWKDTVADPIYRGFNQGITGLLRGVNTLRSGYLDYEIKTSSSGATGSGITRQEQDAINILRQQERDRLTKANEVITFNNQEWLKQHPELAPNAKQLEPTTLQNFFDRDRAIYFFSSNVPMFVTSAIPAIISQVSTGTPIPGLLLAGAVTTPVMTDQVMQDVLANGGTEQDGAAIASSIGIVMGAVELYTDNLVMGIMRPITSKFIRKEVQTEGTSKVITGLAAKGLIGKGVVVSAEVLKVEALEILEEVIQQSMQNAVVKAYNPDRPLFQDIPETMAQTFWAVLPMAGMGGMSKYYDMKSKLPVATQEKLTKVAADLVKESVPVEVAETVALKSVLETTQGQAEVMHAADTVSVMPTSINELDTKDVKITPIEIIYTHPSTGMVFHADTWANLQLQLNQWHSVIEGVGNNSITMANGQLVFTDGNTGTIITAPSWNELIKQVFTFQQGKTTEDLWDELVKGSESPKTTTKPLEAQGSPSISKVVSTPTETELMPPSITTAPVSPIVEKSTTPKSLSKQQKEKLWNLKRGVSDLSKHLDNVYRSMQVQLSRKAGKTVTEQEDIDATIASLKEEALFVEMRMKGIKEQIDKAEAPVAPIAKKVKKAPIAKKVKPAKVKANGYTFINVEPANLPILQKWITKVPESVLGYFTGVELVESLKDETGKLNPSIEGKYDPKTGRILLANTGRKSEVFFHELGHALLTRQLLAGDFSLLQAYGEFELDHFVKKVKVGTYKNIGIDIKSIIIETVANNKGWNIVQADLWLYNNVDRYQAYEESFAEEFSKHIQEKTTEVSKEFFDKIFPPDVKPETPIIQEEAPYRVEGCDIMTDEDGRTVICG
jgi:hypothetical protein